MPVKDTAKVVRINALWDDDAGVWSASSPDVEGLAIEAATREILIERLKTVIPELLALNHAQPNHAGSQQRPPVELIISGRQSVSLVG